jgi:hypothetical protein
MGHSRHALSAQHYKGASPKASQEDAWVWDQICLLPQPTGTLKALRILTLMKPIELCIF